LEEVQDEQVLVVQRTDQMKVLLVQRKDHKKVVLDIDMGPWHAEAWLAGDHSLHTEPLVTSWEKKMKALWS